MCVLTCVMDMRVNMRAAVCGQTCESAVIVTFSVTEAEMHEKKVAV